MDNKNVFIAIALSMSVLLFWAAFFETPKPINKNSTQQEQKKITKILSRQILMNLRKLIKFQELTRLKALQE